MKKTLITLTLLFLCLNTQAMDNEKLPEKYDNDTEQNDNSSETSSVDESTPLLTQNSLIEKTTIEKITIKKSNAFEKYIQEKIKKSEAFLENYQCEQSIKEKASKIANKVINKIGLETAIEWNNRIETKEHNYNFHLTESVIFKQLNRYCSNNPKNCNTMEALLQDTLFLTIVQTMQQTVEDELNTLEKGNND